MRLILTLNLYYRETNTTVGGSTVAGGGGETAKRNISNISREKGGAGGGVVLERAEIAKNSLLRLVQESHHKTATVPQVSVT